MRLLANKWERNTGWPKRLEWIEIHKIRGWTGQRLDFNFPFMAIVGENGAGKSTILQAVLGYVQDRAGPEWEATCNWTRFAMFVLLCLVALLAFVWFYFVPALTAVL